MDTLIEAVNISLQFSESSERRRSLKEWVLDAVRGRIQRKGFKAIDNFIKKVVINQDDILASKREKFRIRVMTNYPYATNATMGVLRKALIHSLEKD